MPNPRSALLGSLPNHIASQMDPHLDDAMLAELMVLYCGRNKLPVRKVRTERRIRRMVNVS